MRLPTLGRNGRYKLEAKTAYGLLSTIVAIVKNDARTMRMCIWGGRPNNAVSSYSAYRSKCGTVGCIGGWIEHLANTSMPARPADMIIGFGWSPNDRHVISELFYGNLCNDDNPGTPSHARKVIALIKRFQKMHRARLLKTKVTVAR